MKCPSQENVFRITVFIAVLAALIFVSAGEAFAVKPPYTPLNTFWAEYFARPSINESPNSWSYPTSVPAFYGFEKNIDLSGAPGQKIKDGLIGPHGYVARWSGIFFFPVKRNYVFSIEGTDGLRLVIDGNYVYDRWQPGGLAASTIAVELSPGWHKIKFKNFNLREKPLARLSWEPRSPEITEAFGAEFFNNTDWQGEACAATIETEIMRDYGYGAPRGVTGTLSVGGENAIPTIDFYSGRWRGLFYFDESTQYKFFLSTDDTGKVMIDDNIIGTTEWNTNEDMSPDPDIAFGGRLFDRFVAAGTHEICVEFSEYVGLAHAYMTVWKDTPPASPFISTAPRTGTDEIRITLGAVEGSREPGCLIDAYCLKNSNDVPSPKSREWKKLDPPLKTLEIELPVKLSATGPHAFYAWFRNTNFCVTEAVSAKIDFIDAIAPKASGFEMTGPEKAFAGEPALFSIALSDNFLVTDYLIEGPETAVESKAGWRPVMVPGRRVREAAAVRFDSPGKKIIGLTARDQAGNISEKMTIEVAVHESREDFEKQARAAGASFAAETGGESAAGDAINASGSWSAAGKRSFTPPEANYPAAVLIGAGEKAYAAAAFQDMENDGRLSFMALSEGVWNYLGKPGLSKGIVAGASLAEIGGQPFAAFSDGGLGGRVRLIAYNGSEWQDMPADGIPATPATAVTLGADRNGREPVLAFCDEMSGGRLFVMRYSDGRWRYAGKGPVFDAPPEGPVSISVSGGKIAAGFVSSGEPKIFIYDGNAWESAAIKTAAAVSGKVSVIFYKDTPYAAFYTKDSGGKIVLILRGLDGKWVSKDAWTPLAAGAADRVELFRAGGTLMLAFREVSSGAVRFFKAGEKNWEELNNDGLKGEFAIDAAYASGPDTVWALIQSARHGGRLSTYRFRNYNSSASSSESALTSEPSISTIEIYFDEKRTMPAGHEIGAGGSVVLFVVARTAGSVFEGPLSMKVNTDTFTEGFNVPLEHAKGSGEYKGSFRIAKSTRNLENALMVGAGTEIGIGIYSREKLAETTMKVAGKWSKNFAVPLSEGTASEISLNLFNMKDNGSVVAFSDMARDGKLSAVRFDEKGCEPVGLGVTSGRVSGLRMAAYNNEIYAAFSDGACGGRLSVMKHNGKKWTYLEKQGFSNGPAAGISMCFYLDKPMVVYSDLQRGGRLAAAKFDGFKWVHLQSPYSEDRSVTAYPAGESAVSIVEFPYVAFSDIGCGGRLSVLRFNNLYWEYAGKPGFTEGEGTKPAIFIYNAVPYVAFIDGAHGGRASVMKFTGNSWDYLGKPGFTKDPAHGLSFYTAYGDMAICISSPDRTISAYAFNGSDWKAYADTGARGTIYPQSLFMLFSMPSVAYSDDENGGKLTLMRLR